MRVVVVGATGNIGTAVLRRLAAEPDVRVAGVSRRAPGAASTDHTGSSGTPFDDIEWLHVDIGRADAVGPLTEHLRGADAVVHLAWAIQPNRDEAAMWRTNVDGARHVLAAVAAAGVPQLVVSSSVGAYSPGPNDSSGSKMAAVGEDWPTDGIPTSAYSRHKVVVERLLDLFEARHPHVAVARLRPGLVFAGPAAAEIARFFIGPLVPTSAFGRLRVPFLPLPRSLTFQAVHADDVAAAVWTVVRHRGTGAYNVAAEPVLTPAALARGLGAGGSRHAPVGVVRALAALTWRLHLQPSDPGWVDIATQVPLMSVDRLTALGWAPTRSATDALAELVEGLRTGRGGPGPALRPRRALSGRTP